MSRSISRAFLAKDAQEIAPLLLNALLVRGECVGRIVEVEAYAGDIDQASHAYRGQTARNSVMFGPPGHLYVYFTYGMHFCANIVCSKSGVATAVLIRAVAPVSGQDEMWRNRPRAKSPRDLCSGPAKLCEALGIDRTLNGADLLDKNGAIQLRRDGVAPPTAPVVSARIGLSTRVGDAATLQWRYAVPGDPNVSKSVRSLV